MAIDREKLRKEMRKAKARSSSGSIRFLPKDSTTSLRIVPFSKDDQGNDLFSRELVQWSRYGTDMKPMVDRKSMFDLPDAFVQLSQVASKMGETFDFKRRTTYIVCAVDINSKPYKAEIWQLPTTVWQAVAEYLLDEEYEDVLDHEEGIPFKISKSGSGLDTKYTVTVGRKSWPITPAIMKGVADPLTAVEDPGLEEQCVQLGFDISDLFDDIPDGADPVKGQAQVVEDKTTEKKSSHGAKQKKKKKSKKSKTKEKEAEVKWQEGDRVLVDIDGDMYPGEITGIEGEDATIMFDDGDEYEFPLKDLEDEKETEPKEEVITEDDIPFEMGARVQVVMDGEVYPGEVSAYDGESEEVMVTFDDGDTGQFSVEDVQREVKKSSILKKAKKGKKSK